MRTTATRPIRFGPPDTLGEDRSHHFRISPRLPIRGQQCQRSGTSSSAGFSGIELNGKASTGYAPIKNGKEPAVTVVMLTTTALRLPDRIRTAMAMELFAETAEIAANDLGGTILGLLPSSLPTNRCGRLRGASRGLATNWEEVMREPRSGRTPESSIVRCQTTGSNWVIESDSIKRCKG
jgi:hypothetical protein